MPESGKNAVSGTKTEKTDSDRLRGGNVRIRIFVLLAALATCASARIIHVPGDSVNIQGGLNIALSGDTVLVATGNYSERIIWPSRDGIKLLSEAGALATVIDAKDSGRVITMNAMNYTSATVVQGFTITRGLLSNYPGNGAGIWCQGSPVFSRNRIVYNRLKTMGYGGGVYCVGAPSFFENIIAWDSIWSAGGGGWRYGAGICCIGSGSFVQNLFLENASFDTFGGGFWYGGALYVGGSALVFNNLFARNQAGATTGGFAYGGALCIDSGSAYVANNTFVANRCSTAVPYGGAIYVNNTRTATIKNNTIVGNIANGIVPFGGGIACRPDTLDTLVFGYNDVWDNSPSNYYSCRPGQGSLSTDPLFVTSPAGDYFLSQIAAGQDTTSPCADAGDTLPAGLDSLLRLWTTRTDSVHDAGIADLGYHYYLAALTALENPGTVWNQGQSLVLRAAPNPFHTRVVFQLPSGTRVQHLEIRDVAGRRVASLAVKDMLVWNGRDGNGATLPAGLYFVSAGQTRLKVIKE